MSLIDPEIPIILNCRLEDPCNLIFPVIKETPEFMVPQIPPFSNACDLLCASFEQAAKAVFSMPFTRDKPLEPQAVEKDNNDFKINENRESLDTFVLSLFHGQSQAIDVETERGDRSLVPAIVTTLPLRHNVLCC